MAPFFIKFLAKHRLNLVDAHWIGASTALFASDHPLVGLAVIVAGVPLSWWVERLAKAEA